MADGLLHFRPNALERRFGGDTSVEIDLRDVVALDVLPREPTMPRKRLMVTTNRGERAVLLVPRVRRVLDQLTAAVTSGNPDAIAAVGAIMVVAVLQTVHGFRRSARVRASRR